MPLNIKALFPKFKPWSRADADVKRIIDIWTDCLTQYGGPFLFGKKPGMADAMYAPVVSRFRTYDIALNQQCVAYCTTMWTLPVMQEWVTAAQAEADDFDELDAEF